MPSGFVETKVVPDLCTVQKRIEYGGGARQVSDQLIPVFQWPVAGRHCRTTFVSTHDDLEQGLTEPLRQLLLPHGFDDQHVRLKRSLKDFLLPLHALPQTANDDYLALRCDSGRRFPQCRPALGVM